LLARTLEGGLEIVGRASASLFAVGGAAEHVAPETTMPSAPL
jgi:hypothetical protein